MRRRASVLVVLALLGPAWPERASAGAGHPPIHLEIAPCVPVQEEAVRQVVAVELGALLTEGAEAAAGVTRVEVDCADERIRLRADDPVTGKTLVRSIDLRTVDPSARDRLLALAIAELVDASWTELVANPRPQVPPAEPGAPPEVRRAALATIRRRVPILRDVQGPRVFGVAAGTGFFSGSGLLFGGGLRLGWDHRKHIGWSADVLGQHGSAATGLGDVSIDLISAGGALLFHRSWSRLSVHLGGGVRGGVAYLSGQPLATAQVKAGSVLGGWGGPLVVASADVQATRRLGLEAHVEGGYVVFPVVGLVAGAPTVAIEGPWLGVQVGVGLRP